MQNGEIHNNKKPNPIIWFFFAIVIPLIVAIIITFVILSIAGINVSEWAKKTGSNIPIVSSFIQTDEEKDLEELKQSFEEKIEAKDAKITELEGIVHEHISTIEKLEGDALKLEQQLQSNENTETQDDNEDVDEQKTVKEIASSYRKMDSAQAAIILEKMDRSIALDILHELSNDKRGEIIEEMTEDKAVEVTEQYIQRTQ